MGHTDRATWRSLLATLRRSHPSLWRQWFEQIEPVEVAGGVYRVRVGSTVQQRYLCRECAQAFNDAAQTVTGALVTVRFEGPENEPQITHEPNDPEPAENGVLHTNGQDATERPPLGARRSKMTDDGLPLDPDNSFDNFVIGPSNRLAHAAALAIAQRPGQAYNPMFIHGGVGLGKTHLLQAVCQRVLETHPGAHILFISCEDFVTRFLEAVQAGEMANFRHQFRDVDMLVLDDIHYLARRERSQDEFFHTFNALHQRGKQIILSSDAAPDEIPEFEDRLVSRFKWGLVARIDKPDYETRVEIVKQKARERGLKMSDDVFALIAARHDDNIRVLEGALWSLEAEAELAGKPIDLDLARRVLGADASQVAQRVTIEAIVELVTEFFNVTLSALQSKRKPRSIALPRQVCMYLAREHTPYSLEEIGGYFGGRDHTTVLHAVQKIRDKRQTDADLNQTIVAIERKLLPN